MTDIRCEPCRILFSQQGLKDLDSPFGLSHRTRGEFEASIQDGCTFCEFLYGLATKRFGKDWAGDDRLLFRNLDQNLEPEGAACMSYIHMLQATVKGSKGALTIFPFAENAATLIRRRPLYRDLQSDSVFSAAKRLIDACVSIDDPSKGHKQCRYSTDTVLPTRVLHVGDSESPDSIVRLQINETETRGAYLALSYCWGDQNQEALFQLHENNLKDLKSGVELSRLSQSIQDAIIATRKLGFKYLWVDALCIIQDDYADKDQELSRMSTIYKNATLTLAAGTAASASEGFLQNVGSDNDPYLPSYKLTIPMEDRQQRGTIYLSAEPYEPEHPLDTRGWTLQEFMLSSRMLIFSNYELLWQCKEVEIQSVTGIEGGLEYQQPLESLPWTAFDDEAEPYFGILDQDKLYLWKTIVLQYTDRKLTKPDDRLRAVQGIKTELEKLWCDTNIYGHWKKWFVQQLVWYKPEMDKVETRHLKRAPSWSWASVDGVIRYEGTLDVEDAKVTVLTMATVELSCRVLRYDDIDEDKLDSLRERPDLANPAATNELGDKEARYLLLGSIKMDDSCEKGVGLLVLARLGRRYRRTGLVIFTDMSIWEGVPRQTITFESREL
ncbi:hypothetical protein ACJ41O_006017 [Fusarium nematophilum]